MAKSKIDFRHLVIEAVLIVFTVLLALGLSEWRNSTKEDKARAAVLSNIIQEIKTIKLTWKARLIITSECLKN